MLIFTPVSNAGRFRLVGPDVRAPITTWLKASHAPLPPATITLVVGEDPGYEPESRTVSIPKGGKLGWTVADERLELFHELGHAFDYTVMRPSGRNEFRKLAQTTCKWWDDCQVPNILCQCGEILDVPPGEMFAEEYAAYSLNMTRTQVDDSGVPTYGWTPPPFAEHAMRLLIAKLAHGLTS